MVAPLYLAVPNTPSRSSNPHDVSPVTDRADLEADANASVSMKEVLNSDVDRRIRVAPILRTCFIALAVVALMASCTEVAHRGTSTTQPWRWSLAEGLVTFYTDVHSLDQKVASSSNVSHTISNASVVRKLESSMNRHVHSRQGLPCVGPGVPVIDLSQAQVVQSNLGGFGPSVGKPEAMIIENVMPDQGRVVNLVVTANSSYSPRSTDENGVSGEFGKVTIENGTTVQLLFQFVDRSTGLPFEMQPYLMTFMTSAFGRGTGALSFNYHPAYDVTDNSFVESISKANGTSFVFTHSLVDEPRSAVNLDSQQKRHAVSILSGGGSSFVATYSVTADAVGKDLMFAGPSSMVCPATQRCSARSCGLDPAAGVAFVDCLDGFCSQADVQKCCRRLVACGNAALDFGNAVVLHNNLDNRGPKPGEPGFTLKNVFPRSGKTIDVEIFATSPYYPFDSSQNGIVKHGANGEHWAQINVRSGTVIDLLFRFVEDPKWNPIEVGPFYITVVGIEDDANGAGHGQLLAGGYEQYFLSADSEMQADESRVDGLTSFAERTGNEIVVGAQSETGNNSTRLQRRFLRNSFRRALTEQQRAVTLLFTNRSSFSISYTVAPGSAGHNLRIGGPSSLACSRSKFAAWADLEDEDAQNRRNVLVKKL